MARAGHRSRGLLGIGISRQKKTHRGRHRSSAARSSRQTRPRSPRREAMKAFLDTSVVVVSFYGEHQHHEANFALLRRQNKSSGCTAPCQSTEPRYLVILVPNPIPTQGLPSYW